MLTGSSTVEDPTAGRVITNPKLGDSIDNIDDVDGVARDIIEPISKMVFLKIIFIDIGITAGTDYVREGAKYLLFC